MHVGFKLASLIFALKGFETVFPSSEFAHCWIKKFKKPEYRILFVQCGKEGIGGGEQKWFSVDSSIGKW